MLHFFVIICFITTVVVKAGFAELAMMAIV